jgi:hypothetical protein
VQRIADWLEKLGMSDCAQRFAENDIDINVLNELTTRTLIGLASHFDIAEGESLVRHQSRLSQTANHLCHLRQNRPQGYRRARPLRAATARDPTHEAKALLAELA